MKIEFFSAIHFEALVFSFTIFFYYSETLSLLEVLPQKFEKNPPSSCDTSLLKYLFGAVTIIMRFPVVNFTDDCVLSFALGLR